jgi:succinoglycan biosynthesis protein ExoL
MVSVLMNSSSATPAPSPSGIIIGDQRITASGASRMQRKTIAFFSQDISDVSTIKRVQQFLSRNFAVTVLGFRRDRYNADFKPDWPHVLLGYTHDRRYIQRLFAILGAIPKMWAERAALATASIFYARNLDQLFLALIARVLTNRKVTVVYEVLDIQPVQAGSGVVSRMVRLAERVCLSSVRYLVLSSTGFYRNFYGPVQNYEGAWVLLENKLPEPIRTAPRIDAAQPTPRLAKDRWVIGYFGLIRGQQTVDLIVRLAQRLGDRVEFRFRGAFTTVDEARFHDALAALPNVSFGGRFSNPDDLPELYGGVDFAWGIDLENTDSNSRWLLPCRLYEAGYFAVPCLAARGFELGNRVEDFNIGWAFDMPFEDGLVRFFETLTPEAYREKQRALQAMPDNAFVAGVDLDALCRVLADPEWAFSERRRTGRIEQHAS